MPLDIWWADCCAVDTQPIPALHLAVIYAAFLHPILLDQGPIDSSLISALVAAFPVIIIAFEAWPDVCKSGQWPQTGVETSGEESVIRYLHDSSSYLCLRKQFLVLPWSSLRGVPGHFRSRDVPKKLLGKSGPSQLRGIRSR